MNSSFGGGGRQVSSNFGQGPISTQAAAGMKRKAPDESAPPALGMAPGVDAQQGHSFPSLPARAPPDAAAGVEMPTRVSVPPPSAPTAPAPTPQPLPHPPALASHSIGPPDVHKPPAPAAPISQWPHSKPAPKNVPIDQSRSTPLPPSVPAKPVAAASAAPASKLLTSPPAPLLHTVAAAAPASSVAKLAPEPQSSVAKQPAPSISTITAALLSKPPAVQPIKPQPPLGDVAPVPTPSIAVPISKPVPSAVPTTAPAPLSKPTPQPVAAQAIAKPAPPKLSTAPSVAPSHSAAPSNTAVPAVPAAAAAAKAAGTSIPSAPPPSSVPKVMPAPFAQPTSAIASPPPRHLSIAASQSSQLTPRPKLAQPLPMGLNLNKSSTPMTRAAPSSFASSKPSAPMAKGSALAFTAAPAAPKLSAGPQTGLSFTKPAAALSAVPPPPPGPSAPILSSVTPIPSSVAPTPAPLVAACVSVSPQQPPAVPAPAPPVAAAAAPPKADAEMANAEDYEILPDVEYVNPAEEIAALRTEIGRMQMDHLTQSTKFRERVDHLQNEIEDLTQRLARKVEEQSKRESDAELREKLARTQTELARAKAEAAEAQAKIAAAAALPPPVVPPSDDARAIAARVAKLPAPTPAAVVAPGRLSGSSLGTAHLLKKLFFRTQAKGGLVALYSGSGADESQARKAQELQSALSTAMNPDASPVLLLPPLYSFALAADANTVENALDLVLLLVQSSAEVRKAMLYGAQGSEQQRVVVAPDHQFARLSIHPLLPRNPRIRLSVTPPAAAVPEPPQPPPNPDAARANEILRNLISRLPALRNLSGTALEHALSIISTVLDSCPVSVLRSLQDLIVPLLQKDGDATFFVAEILHTASHSLSERIVEFISAVVPCRELYLLVAQGQLHRLVKLVNAKAATLSVRHRVVRLFRYCMGSYRDQLVPILLLDRENDLHFLDRLVIMLESELDTCCIYPGPTGRIPNPASRLFVAETCYLLWQCMAAVGPRAMISHRVPLQAIASRLVLGELDPELRGLATFGKYFISFQYADDSMAMQEQEEAARAERERERSEGYSSPPR